MNIAFFNSFQSEWIKKRRSAASWLTIAGSMIIPVIMLIAAFARSKRMPRVYASEHFWESIISNCWQPMAMFLLPLGLVLATSLVAQIEYRNNTWKQVHTTPQSLTTIFLAKYAVIFVMVLEFFVLFNIGIYITAIVPTFFIEGVSFPKEPFPVSFFLETNLNLFIDCLPIIALQFLLALSFRNFLLPLGAGIALFVGSMIAIQWRYGYTFPYTYGALEFLREKWDYLFKGEPPQIHYWALGYFGLFTMAGYLLYVFKRVKG